MDAPEQPTKCKACAAPIVQQEVKNEDEDERGTAVYRKRAVKPIIEDECDMNFQDEDEDKIKVKSEHEDQDNVEVENEDEDGNENDVKVKSEVQDKDDSDIKNVDMEGRESGNAHENDYDIDEREVTQAFDDDYDDEKHVQCALCKGAWYCSDKCETADFLSHRDSCRVRQRVFALQKQCFMCEKSIENEEIHCTACDRIMYCSAACQEADKEEHDLICGAYAELGPRPSKAHRICILFPEDEPNLRLVWIPPWNRPALESAVTLERLHLGVVSGPRVDLDDNNPDLYRIVFLYHVESFVLLGLNYNTSLEVAMGKGYSTKVMGPLLITVCEYSEEEEDISSDATPGDLLAALKYSKRYLSKRYRI